MKQKRVLREIHIPEIEELLNTIPKDSEIFVEKSMAIANRIAMLLDANGVKQKDLAEKMGKSEAEVSKLLSGMHNYTLRSIAKMEAALGFDIICTPSTQRLSVSNMVSGIKSSYMVISKRPLDIAAKPKFSNNVIPFFENYNTKKNSLKINAV